MITQIDKTKIIIIATSCSKLKNPIVWKLNSIQIFRLFKAYWIHDNLNFQNSKISFNLFIRLCSVFLKARLLVFYFIWVHKTPVYICKFPVFPLASHFTHIQFTYSLYIYKHHRTLTPLNIHPSMSSYYISMHLS